MARRQAEARPETETFKHLRVGNLHLGGAHGMNIPSISVSVRLTDDAMPVPTVKSVRGQPAIFLPVSGLNREVIEGWLGRLGVKSVAARSSTAQAHRSPLIRCRTLVVCCDERLEALARVYAEALGARVVSASTPGRVEGHLRNAVGVQSMTLFLLHDVLDEPLLHSLWTANRDRQRVGHGALPVGLLTGLDPAHVGWLMVKTLLWLCVHPRRERMELVDFDGFTDRLWGVSVDPRTGRAAPGDGGPRPWTSPAMHAAALFTHSVSFDASLGDLALCGHSDPPLAHPPAVAPSCYFDGRCFRVERSEGQLLGTLRAVHATPLFWFLNGCGVIPLAASAFGSATAYAYGLLAGSALGVVGPYVTQVSNTWRNRVFLGLLAAGATQGEAAEALCGLAPREAGFALYCLLGSPDVRLLPPKRLLPVGRAGPLRYRVRGSGAWALRLELPSRFRGRPVVVADDGGAAWDGAGSQVLALGKRREMLVLLDRPRDLDGWLELDPSRGREHGLGEDAAEIERRLQVLKLYRFAGPEHLVLEACRSTAAQIIAVLAVPALLRHQIYAAALCAKLESSLEDLHRRLASRFLEEVAARDVNLDRESFNGFVPGPVIRSRRRCPACRSLLFCASDRWQGDERYRRRKDVCANCFAVAMVLDSSPLAVSPPRLHRLGPGRTLELLLGLRNRTDRPLRAWLAAAPRFGGSATQVAPFVVELKARATAKRTLRLDLEPLPPGTVSVRLIVLARGSAEFHSFKLRSWTARPAGSAARSGWRG